MCFFITTGMGLPSFSLYTKESFWGCDSKFKYAGLLGPMIFEWFPPSGRWAHLRPWELQNWRSHFARGTKFQLTAQGRGEVVKISKRPIPREFWFWRVVCLLNSRSEKRIYFSLKLNTANSEWDRVCLQHGHPLLQKLCGAKKATNLFFEMQHCNTLALLFLSLRLTSSICRFFSSTETIFNSIWGHSFWKTVANPYKLITYK